MERGVVPPVFNGRSRRLLIKVATASLPRLGVAPIPLARLLCKPQKLPFGAPFGEFRVSSGNLLRGVSLPRGSTGGVGVDERVEGASGRPPGFVLLDVDQVDQAAPVRPLVES